MVLQAGPGAGSAENKLAILKGQRQELPPEADSYNLKKKKILAEQKTFFENGNRNLNPNELAAKEREFKDRLTKNALEQFKLV